MIQFKNIAWKFYHGALLPQTAPHIKIELNKEEEKELLKLSKAYFLRYTSDWDGEEQSQFWYVIKDHKENLEQYKSKIRNQIKRGLKNCIVKKVSKTEIANYGYEVYKSAVNSYHTNLTSLDKETFQNQILSCVNHDFWAVYTLVGTLIAYSQNVIENNSINYSTIKFHPEYLKRYPSYALFFKMNQYYLNEKNFLYVNDGARSISHDTNIQTFLIDKFKFRKTYCKLHIVYRWDIGLVVKVLYPFRSLLPKENSKIFNKLSVLLNQEEIRRSFEK